MSDEAVLTIAIKARDEATSVFSEIGGEVADLGAKAQGSASKFPDLWKQIGLGSLAAQAVSSATNAITNSISDAINRVDTLNNSTAVFANLGFKASDVKTAMSGLQKSILGLPTSLDQAVSGMQSLALQNGNIVQAQKEFTAMNDAVLASGHTTADLDNAIQQITQLDMHGPLDAQTWDSLRQSGLEPAMSAMAKMSGISMADLKTAFGSGKLTVQDFMNNLQTLDTNGTGNMASLSKQAKDMTSGIGTGMDNAKTAITRGIADIIQAIGSKNISTTISEIGKAFESVGKNAAMAVTFLKQHHQVIMQIVGVVGPMAGGILLVVGAMKAWKIATDAVKAAQIMLTAVMDMNPIILAIMAVVAVAALVVTHWDTVKKWFSNFLGWMSTHWEVLLGVITGPLGLAIVWVVQNWGKIKDFFGGLWSDIKDIFSGAGNWLYDIGKNIIQGLINGVKDMKNAATGAVKNVGSDMVNGFKGLLGIHSPSTVFAEAGQNIGQGLAQGITSSKPLVQSATNSLVNVPAATRMSVAPSLTAGSTLPAQGSAGTGGNTGVTFNAGGITVNIGMYAGNATEKQQIAIEIWQQLMSYARSHNLAGNVPNFGVRPL